MGCNLAKEQRQDAKIDNYHRGGRRESSNFYKQVDDDEYY